MTATNSEFATIRIYRGGTLYQIPVERYLSQPDLQKVRLIDGDVDIAAAVDGAAANAVKKAARARAMGAATLAFVRNRVSAPRDMSAHAAV